ncbi:MAG: DNA-binding response regulator [Actinobacteria bacterium]|nr:MAG: DNA-binding response regulator [Actinomycetota bacterium]
MSKKILIADDEKPIVNSLKYCLEKEGYLTVSALSGAEAIEVFEKESPDLILLDLMLPKITGENVCKLIRKTSDVPIIMLTAKATETNKIIGLSVGADDYVTKPFSVRELIARIKALLRRSGRQSVKSVITAGPFEYDENKHQIAFKNKSLSLPLKEYKLLKNLIINSDKTLTRDYLLNKVWDSYTDPKTLDVHMSSLRKRLEKNPSKPKYLVTARGIGYRLETN